MPKQADHVPINRDRGVLMQGGVRSAGNHVADPLAKPDFIRRAIQQKPVEGFSGVEGDVASVADGGSQVRTISTQLLSQAGTMRTGARPPLIPAPAGIELPGRGDERLRPAPIAVWACCWRR